MLLSMIYENIISEVEDYLVLWEFKLGLHN